MEAIFGGQKPAQTHEIPPINLLSRRILNHEPVSKNAEQAEVMISYPQRAADPGQHRFPCRLVNIEAPGIMSILSLPMSLTLSRDRYPCRGYIYGSRSPNRPL